MVGSGLQSMTPLPADPLDPADPLPCRNIVFRLRETPTFQKLTSKVLVTLHCFARERPRTLFFTIENRGGNREGLNVLVLGTKDLVLGTKALTLKGPRPKFEHLRHFLDPAVPEKTQIGTIATLPGPSRS